MSYGRYYGFAPYVSVAEKRRRAEKAARKQLSSGETLEPAEPAKLTFWGKAWQQNLLSYADMSNRMPRGRSYFSNGSVIDLKMQGGVITSLVCGTSLYKVSIHIQPLPRARWEALKQTCSGQIESLVGLLQGKLPDSVMKAVTKQEALFPAPKEMSYTCSCPDSASMCKHIAATLYGAGARMDRQPDLLFSLRGVDHLELVSQAGALLSSQAAAAEADIAADDLSDIFGIELDTAPAPAAAAKKAPAKKTPAKKTAAKKTAAKKTAAKKTAAKKTAAKKTPAKKTPAKKTAAKGPRSFRL